MARRIACLLIPDLPLRAELRVHPELAEVPLVIASGADARADLIALSPLARRAGVCAWSSVAQARAACPELRVRVASPALERAARRTLLDIALSLSPRAALAPRAAGLFAAEGCVFLEAGGMSSVFASENGFASALAERAMRHGFPGFVSLASSCTIALLVARRMATDGARTAGSGAIAVLSPEHESEFLAPLPIDLLDPDDRLAQSLTRLGVRSVGDLLGLPPRGLAQRLGPEVMALIARARGEEVEPPLPVPRSLDFEETIDLDAPVSSLEPLTFVLRGLLSRLLERLLLRGLACGPLDLALELEGGARDIRRVGVAGASLDLRVLLRLVTLSLSESPPQAPIEGLSLRTGGMLRRRDQLDLFRPHGPDPSELDRTLSELESLCGEGRVGTPHLPDGHHPSAHGIKPFSPPPALPPPADAGSFAPPAMSHPPALRALRPPVRAEVEVCGGRPAFVRSGVARGDVVEAAGPWRTTGHWWSENERYALDHFDVQVSDGMVVRLCFDWLQRVWQIDGVYD